MYECMSVCLCSSRGRHFSSPNYQIFYVCSSLYLSVLPTLQLSPWSFFFFLTSQDLDLCLSHDNLWSLSIGQEVNSTCPTSSLDRNMFSLHAYLVFTCNCRSFEYVFITKPEKFSEKVFSICRFSALKVWNIYKWFTIQNDCHCRLQIYTIIFNFIFSLMTNLTCFQVIYTIIFNFIFSLMTNLTCF